METIVEVVGFLLFWVYDLLKETIFVIFRCRPQKDIKKENILITGTGNYNRSEKFIILVNEQMNAVRQRLKSTVFDLIL